MEKYQDQLIAYKMDGQLNLQALVRSSLYCCHYAGV